MTNRLVSMRKIFEEFLKKREGEPSFVRKTFSLEHSATPFLMRKENFDTTNPTLSLFAHRMERWNISAVCGASVATRLTSGVWGVMGRVRTDMLLTALSWFVKPGSIKLLYYIWTCTTPAPVPWFRKNLEKPTGDQPASEYGANALERERKNKKSI
jgi:hypothetical protein